MWYLYMISHMVSIWYPIWYRYDIPYDIDMISDMISIWYRILYHICMISHNRSLPNIPQRSQYDLPESPGEFLDAFSKTIAVSGSFHRWDWWYILIVLALLGGLYATDPTYEREPETAIDQKHEKMGRLYWTPGYGFGTVTLNLDLCLTTLRKKRWYIHPNWGKKTRRWAMKKEPLILFFGGGYVKNEILHSYMGNMKHKPWNKDPGTLNNQYFTVQVSRFFRGSGGSFNPVLKKYAQVKLDHFPNFRAKNFTPRNLNIRNKALWSGYEAHHCPEINPEFRGLLIVWQKRWNWGGVPLESRDLNVTGNWWFFVGISKFPKPFGRNDSHRKIPWIYRNAVIYPALGPQSRFPTTKNHHHHHHHHHLPCVPKIETPQNLTGTPRNSKKKHPRFSWTKLGKAVRTQAIDSKPSTPRNDAWE